MADPTPTALIPTRRASRTGVIHRRRRETGIALITTLIFLVVLSLFAVNAAMTSGLEIRMAGSMGDQDQAFQASEAALRDGEAWLASRTSRPVPEAAGSTCTIPCDVWAPNVLGDFPDATVKTTLWWQTNAHPATDTIAGVATQPYYVIEEQKFVPDTLTLGLGVPPGHYYYLTTARGTGGSDAARVVLQTHYARRY